MTKRIRGNRFFFKDKSVIPMGHVNEQVSAGTTMRPSSRLMVAEKEEEVVVMVCCGGGQY